MAQFPVIQHGVGQNIFQTQEEHMAWSYQCKQGICCGNQVIFARVGVLDGVEVLQVCDLHRTEGWQGASRMLFGDLTFDDLCVFLLPHLFFTTVHIRLFLYVDDPWASLSIPDCNQDLWQRKIICEVSVNPWMCSPECSAFSEGVGWPLVS